MPAVSDEAAPLGLTDPRLEVQVLGPVRALRDGMPLSLGGQVPTALVARLALARGSVVPDGTLVDDLWEDDPPANATGSLQTYVSRLRKVLGAASPALVRVGPGYALKLGAGALDADAFEQLTTRARHLLARGLRPDAADAAAAFADALALWHGPACADVADRPFAVAEAHRLTELRTATVEARLDATVAASGRGTDLGPVAAELEAFVRDHPLRERAWQVLALALYRQGRQADALRALRTLRDSLADELGADPSPATMDLQTAILTQQARLLPEPDAPSTATTATATETTTAHDADRALTPTVPAPVVATSNVPVPLVTLIGRQDELSRVRQALTSHRLVTLTGAGGTGKTSLAVVLARAREDADGPFLVELAGLHDPALLAPGVASALGLAGTSGPAALAAVLRDREFLLVIDNAEHLLDAVAPLVATLLRGCPGLRVLVTSREPLGVPGEVVHEVPPLAWPDAVDLFLERASTTGGALEETDRELVRQLCQRLDGLPLAIELAAGQTRALSLPQISELLSQSLTLLRVRRPTTPHHATMRAAIQWSWDRLDSDEQEVFEALAIFEDGFTLQAAERVTGRRDTVMIVADLVAKSLVVAPASRSPRYRVLETLRQFSAEQTPQHRRAELVERHLDWIEELTAHSDPALHGRSGPLPQEVANVRAALAAADPASVLRIGSRFYWFWYAQGLVAEGLGFLLPALAAADAAAEAAGGPTPAQHAIMGRASIGVALLTYLTGNLPGVVAALTSAGTHAAQCEDHVAQAQVLATTSYFEARSGQVAAGREHAMTALMLADATGQTSTRAESLMVLGEVERQDGNLDAAVDALEHAVEAASRVGYAWAAMSSRWIQTKVEISRGRLEAAESTALDCLERSAAAGETTTWLVALATLSHLRLLRGQAPEAAELAGAVAWIGGRVGFSPATMDPDLEAYGAQLADELDPDDFARWAERGRGTSPEAVLARVRSMVAELDAVSGARD